MITQFDGDEIRSVEVLFTALRGTEPGQSAPLTVTRDGDTRERTVEIGSRTS